MFLSKAVTLRPALMCKSLTMQCRVGKPKLVAYNRKLISDFSTSINMQIILCAVQDRQDQAGSLQ